MLELVQGWFKRTFSDPEAVAFIAVLAVIVFIIMTMGSMLAPVLASVVIAYLLEWPVSKLRSLHMPRTPAVMIVFAAFLGLFVYALIGPLPLLVQQLTAFINELPSMLDKGQTLINSIPEAYPDMFSGELMGKLLNAITAQLGRVGQSLVSQTITSIPSLISLIVYLVMVPLLVYFFLKDRREIVAWIGQFMPKRRHLLTKIWEETHAQIGNYIRGKVLEIFIVWIATYITFALLHMPYAMLLSVLVGLSVLIPYIGAIVVTIPIVIIAFVNWGWTQDFAYLMIAYGIIVTIDGNILPAILFSEALDVHPVAIIISILFFGGIAGFWGIFFAIPLASLVKAIINAWPRVPVKKKPRPRKTLATTE